MARKQWDGVPRDTYQEITNKIVASLEDAQKHGKWERPWTKGASAGYPSNAVTGADYRGINVTVLMCHGLAYDSSVWATYKQWQSLRAQVKKDSKGALVVKVGKSVRVQEMPHGEDKVTAFPWLKAYTVFNAAQVDGYTPVPIERPSLAKRIEHVEAYIRRLKAHIVHGSAGVFYQPGTDTIHMPDMDRFKDTSTRTATEAYYSVLLHELIHWTGVKSRLDRNLRGFFGDEDYAFEEMVAELGAAFCCAKLGITDEPRMDHAKYLVSWLKGLRQHNKLIFKASTLASAAVSFLDGPQEAQEGQGEDDASQEMDEAA